jgi:hypothetical protein
VPSSTMPARRSRAYAPGGLEAKEAPQLAGAADELSLAAEPLLLQADTQATGTVRRRTRMRDLREGMGPVPLHFRIPSRRRPVELAAGILAWVALLLVAHAAAHWGPVTVLGPGLVGAVTLPLPFEAWLCAGRRWRLRVCHTLQFAIPSLNLLALASLVPSTCCFCDDSPGAKALRIAELTWSGAHYQAVALLPAFAVLLALRPPSSSSANRVAHARATFVAVSSTLLVAVFLISVTAVLRFVTFLPP